MKFYYLFLFLQLNIYVFKNNKTVSGTRTATKKILMPFALDFAKKTEMGEV